MLQIRVLTVLGQATVVTELVPDEALARAVPALAGQVIQPLGYYADGAWPHDGGTASLVNLLERALDACGGDIAAWGGWQEIV